MKAEIISIGTELLLGTITDTNASYLAQRLADLGIDCFYVSQVGDNEQRIVGTLRRAIERSDLVITTGGLGPTGDDLTRESIATLLNETPVVVPELEERLRAFFARRGVTMPDRNLKQATLIPSARTLNNPVGTAPGWLVKTDTPSGTPSGERFIVSMPGVPFEMKRMWEHEVEPWLRPLCPDVLVSRTLKILGLGESAIDEKVSDLMDGSNPTLAPYAKQDGVHLRISAKAATERDALEMITPVEEQVRERLGDAIYGVNDETPAEVVIDLLSETGATIAILEIGAGATGAISAQLAGYDGFVGGMSAYSVHDAFRLLNGHGTESTLEQASFALRRVSAADLVVALMVMQEPAGTNNAVKASAEMLLASSEESGTAGRFSTTSEWTTTAGEVPRLVGLVALNTLRRWMLTQRKRERQLDAV